MRCDWKRSSLPCVKDAEFTWTRVGHRTVYGKLMSPDGVETVNRCASHPMGEHYGWTKSPVDKP